MSLLGKTSKYTDLKLQYLENNEVFYNVFYLKNLPEVSLLINIKRISKLHYKTELSPFFKIPFLRFFKRI